MAEQEFNKKVEDLTDAEYTWIEQLMNDYGNTMKPEDKPRATEDDEFGDTGAGSTVDPVALISGAVEEEVPYDRSEGDRARDELRNQDSVFVTEEDPDFENDPDYQGFVDDVKVEPSQYTQSGMDKEEKNRGDVDNDALEAITNQGTQTWWDSMTDAEKLETAPLSLNPYDQLTFEEKRDVNHAWMRYHSEHWGE